MSLSIDEILKEFPFLEYEEIEHYELEEYYHWLMKEREIAERSYPEGENHLKRYCSRCGELLLKGCLAYDEGYHFDSCI